jgi:nitroreductase
MLELFLIKNMQKTLKLTTLNGKPRINQIYRNGGFVLNETLSTLKERRSIRNFTAEQIKDSEIEVILEAGAYAPSSANRQSWHFTVVQKEHLINQFSQAIKKLYAKMDIPFLQKLGSNEKAHLFHHTPSIIVISGDQTVLEPLEDCCLAAGNIMNAAKSLNIGSCWISGFPRLANSDIDGPLIEELHLPDGYKPVCAIAMGYCAGENPKAAVRKENVTNYIK